MTLKDKFQAQPWFPALAQRKNTFAQMIEHFEKAAALGLNQIIETGTARDRGNWHGEGQSTLIWDWVAHELSNIQVVSIDNNPNAIKIAQSQTKRVHYHEGDSVEFLSFLSKQTVSKTGLLYLDSMDWDYERGYISACHHLTELLAVWEKLPKNCMIAVDDVHGTHHGKHVAILEFMDERGFNPVFYGHQIAWIKT